MSADRLTDDRLEQLLFQRHPAGCRCPDGDQHEFDTIVAELSRLRSSVPGTTPRDCRSCDAAPPECEKCRASPGTTETGTRDWNLIAAEVVQAHGAADRRWLDELYDPRWKPEQKRPRPLLAETIADALRRAYEDGRAALPVSRGGASVVVIETGEAGFCDSCGLPDVACSCSEDDALAPSPGSETPPGTACHACAGFVDHPADSEACIRKPGCVGMPPGSETPRGAEVVTPAYAYTGQAGNLYAPASPPPSETPRGAETPKVCRCADRVVARIDPTKCGRCGGHWPAPPPDADGRRTNVVRAVTLRDLECVDCDECHAIGRWRYVGPNHFACKACGAEIQTEPCDCEKPSSGDARKDGE